jgi:hypothetical protein
MESMNGFLLHIGEASVTRQRSPGASLVEANQGRSHRVRAVGRAISALGG